VWANQDKGGTAAHLVAPQQAGKVVQEALWQHLLPHQHVAWTQKPQRSQSADSGGGRLHASQTEQHVRVQPHAHEQ